MSRSELSDASVAGVQLTVNCNESVPLATYLKTAHRLLPSAQWTLLLTPTIVTMNCLLSSVTVGSAKVGAVAYAVSPGLHRSPVGATLCAVLRVTLRPDT